MFHKRQFVSAVFAVLFALTANHAISQEAEEEEVIAIVGKPTYQVTEYTGAHPIILWYFGSKLARTESYFKHMESWNSTPMPPENFLCAAKRITLQT